MKTQTRPQRTASKPFASSSRKALTALVAMLAVSLSVTAFAATSPCAPGCDCKSGDDGKGVLGQMERHADAVRARDKAYAQQIFKQPDNTMGMTCFDRSLAVTSRLGQIFSDRPPGTQDPNASSGPFSDSTISGIQGITSSLGVTDLENARAFLNNVNVYGEVEVGDTLNTLKAAGVTNISNPAAVVSNLQRQGVITDPQQAAGMQEMLRGLNQSGVSDVPVLQGALDKAHQSGVQNSLRDVNSAIGKGMKTVDQVSNTVKTIDNLLNATLPAMNSSVFGPSKSPSMGLDKSLGTSMNSVLSPQMQAHAKNYEPSAFSSGSLSMALGATSLGYMGTYANGLQSQINQITNGPLRDIQTASNVMNGIMTTVNGAMKVMKLMPPITVAGQVAIVNGILRTIDTTVNRATSIAMKAIAQLMASIFSKSSDQNSLAKNPCNRMNQLWSGAGSPAGFKSIVGSGIEKGVPYFDLKSLASGKITGAGPDLMQSVLNNGGGNNSVLSRALKDMNGPLSAPGKMPSWTAPPVFTPSMSSDDVISMMGGGGTGE